MRKADSQFIVSVVQGKMKCFTRFNCCLNVFPAKIVFPQRAGSDDLDFFVFKKKKINMLCQQIVNYERRMTEPT